MGAAAVQGGAGHAGTEGETALDLRLTVTRTPPRGWTPVKVRCLNPAHNDGTASLAVYPDNLHCYGCGWHESNPDRALAALLGAPVDEAVSLRTRYMSGEAVELRAQRQARANEPLEPMASALADVYNAVLRHERRERAEWLTGRGLTWDTINAAKLGHDGQWFTIPVFGPRGTDELITIRYRIDAAFLDTPYDKEQEKRFKYSGTTGRNQQYLYPEWLMAADERDWFVLCEGELDALRLWQDGIPALAITNGAGQCDLALALADERVERGVYRPKYRVYVATDMDERGREAAESVMRTAEALRLRATRLEWDGAKDVTEYLANGGNLHEHVRGA